MRMRLKLIQVVIVFVLSLSGCARFCEPSVERRISSVERGLVSSYSVPPWDTMALAERMEHYKVPGVSIAVIDAYQIEWAKGYGVLEAGRNDRVTAETLFQTASVGKPVVAAAALHHVDRGILELDRDVNDYLTSWQVPENAFTAERKVTLRRLLSHSAGMTVPGFRGYAWGEAVPNLEQILNGERPANSPPIRVDSVPGNEYRYSGGGYMVVQQLLEDVTGQPFPDIMQETILGPWGMSASTFESPLPQDLWAIAAAGHRGDGSVIPGGWHAYPEMGSGASMWATPSDLARFAIGVMEAYSGRSEFVLSQDMASQMLTPRIGQIGLGPAVLYRRWRQRRVSELSARLPQTGTRGGHHDQQRQRRGALAGDQAQRLPRVRMGAGQYPSLPGHHRCARHRSPGFYPPAPQEGSRFGRTAAGVSSRDWLNSQSSHRRHFGKWTAIIKWNISENRTRLNRKTTDTRRQQMESESSSRCSEIASDLFIILVTAANLVFFAFFHDYIAWYSRGPDGTFTRLSLLTDDYFTWLPFPVTASIIVIVASVVMIFYHRYWFRQGSWIGFCLLGITMTTSLLLIWPFDFSVIPDAKAADLLPKGLTGLLIFMALFYAVTAVIQTVQWIKKRSRQETG